jgi:hypothetical protein
MENTVEVIKKKRGRKPKSALTPSISNNNITIIIEESNAEQAQPTEVVNKKRGRKPKGGKLIDKPIEIKDAKPTFTNIILHLKCSTQELNDHNNKINKIMTDPLLYNPNIPPNIMTYNTDNSTTFSEYTNNAVEIINDKPDQIKLAYSSFEKTQSICSSCNLKMEMEESAKNYDEDDDIDIKDVNSKLKKLKLQLYKNSNPDKKAACFWCTYDYDNPSCYIPKYEMDGELYGYGSFCRPECAVAYLMKENLDDSTKFERYHLLNQLYSKVYDYKKNIKPAPNPYFLLEKYYGNLTIQEYRKLLKTEHMLLVIEKPMTRNLPELHEDNEDFIMNIYGGKTASSSNKTGVYKVKRQSEKQKGPSKSSIMKENFGLS